MKNFLAGTAAAAATLAFVTGAFAVGPPYTEVHPAPTINAPAPGAADCQAAIAKNSQKYLKSVLKTRSKCLYTSVAHSDIAACPNDETEAKIQKNAVKASDAIAEACGTSTGLANTY